MSANRKPASGRVLLGAPRSLRKKADGELERIVRENAHDPKILSAVEDALTHRSRKRADALRVKIHQHLASLRRRRSPPPDVPIWATAAPLSTEKPWYFKLRYVFLCAGFVAIALVNGFDSYLAQMIQDGVQSLDVRFNLD